MNEYHQRMWPGAIRLPEIEYVALVIAIGNVQMHKRLC